MDERLKELTIEHSNVLEKMTMYFFGAKLKEEEEDKGLVINLIISGFVTAMSNMLMRTVEGNEHDEMLMKKFIKNLKDSIKAIDHINNVETTTK